MVLVHKFLNSLIHYQILIQRDGHTFNFFQIEVNHDVALIFAGSFCLLSGWMPFVFNSSNWSHLTLRAEQSQCISVHYPVPRYGVAQGYRKGDEHLRQSQKMGVTWPCILYLLYLYAFSGHIFSLPLLPKAKRPLGNKESGLVTLGPKN